MPHITECHIRQSKGGFESPDVLLLLGDLYIYERVVGISYLIQAETVPNALHSSLNKLHRP